MTKTLDAVLLLALPASGKSEVRKYLDSLSPESAKNDFHMGPTVQLDDFPYVHMMRRIDEELEKLGKPRIYFQAPDKPFKNARDWGTLVHLMNEDYSDIVDRKVHKPASPALHFFDRLDSASKNAGENTRLAMLDEHAKTAVAKAIDKEAAKMLNDKHKSYPDTLEGKTFVVEFARGGPAGSSMPLPPPLGYRYSIGELSRGILERAVVLYIWVTPEESRRKNDARTDPNDPGSILHHGVPLDVMMNDYGCDDMDWLQARTDIKGTVTIEAHNTKFNIPVARFDNRVDKTSFLREDEKKWKPNNVKTVHEGLKSALDRLVNFSIPQT